MIYPLYNQSLIGLIRIGLCRALMLADEDGKWQRQKGKGIEFWYKMPQDPGSYNIAKGIIYGVRDFVWHAQKSLMTVINEDGSWERISDPKRQEEIVKYCGWNSLVKFKDTKQEDYTARIIYWDYSALKFIS